LVPLLADKVIRGCAPHPDHAISIDRDTWDFVQAPQQFRSLRLDIELFDHFGSLCVDYVHAIKLIRECLVQEGDGDLQQFGFSGVWIER